MRSPQSDLGTAEEEQGAVIFRPSPQGASEQACSSDYSDLTFLPAGAEEIEIFAV